MTSFKDKVIAEIHSKGCGHHPVASNEPNRDCSDLQRVINETNNAWRDEMTYGRVRIMLDKED